jgi:predicted HTH transcriptional regulator
LPTLYDNKVGNKQKPMSQTRQTILEEMRNNSNITKVELQRLLKISSTAIDNNIAYLKKNGHIERVSSNKSGYWKVNEK